MTRSQWDDSKTSDFIDIVHSQENDKQLKVPYDAKFNFSMFSNNNQCRYPVNELSRNDESPSFTFFACPTFDKACAKL